uniref:glycosyltransferase family 2 protein n=1 Tax=Prevotella sp. TaxID=59823 RepID=UPI004026C1BC
MDKLITVIIPSYNMEAYLERCVRSLLCPGYQRIEAIIVNDGSHDGTLKLARALEAERPDMVRVIDKPNGNYGSCVNAALPLATGKYVKVLDADDCFDTSSLGTYLDSLERSDADYIVNDMVKVWADHEEVRTFKWEADKDLDLADVYQDDGFLKITMHDVAYKTALVRSIGYKQTEGVSYSDVEWNFTPLVAVRTMRYMPVPLYRYTLGRPGQTVADGMEDRHFCDNVTVMKSMVEHYARRGDIPAHIEWLTERLLARRAKFVYRRCLLRLADTTEPALALLDKQVQALTPTLSHYLDHMRLSTPLLPMHYIRLWRRNPNDWRYRLGVTMYHWLH